jgi:DNA polymerase-4
VGGSGRGGVVAAASYEARVFGVKSAMPGSMAARLCPDLIFVRGSYEAYSTASKQVRAIFEEFSDLVEPMSIDEAYLDVTINKKGIESATEIAEMIRKRIFEETQLTASAGVSFNKFLAKVASGHKKPNGITVIKPSQSHAFLSALPIGTFHGIGAVTAKKMHKLGILTGADLLRWSKQDLARLFGRSGIWYYHVVRGEDNRPVETSHIRKSVGAEDTFFTNLTDVQEMLAEINLLSIKVFQRLQKHNDSGRTVTVKIKSSDFQVITRAKSFPESIKSQEELFEIASELLIQNHQTFESIRLLGVTVSNLDKARFGGQGVQMELPFEDV